MFSFFNFLHNRDGRPAGRRVSEGKESCAHLKVAASRPAKTACVRRLCLLPTVTLDGDYNNNNNVVVVVACFLALATSSSSSSSDCAARMTNELRQQWHLLKTYNNKHISHR